LEIDPDQKYLQSKATALGIEVLRMSQKNYLEGDGGERPIARGRASSASQQAAVFRQYAVFKS
jgi:hypothetical protein